MHRPNLSFKIDGKTPVRRLGYGALHLTGPGYWGPPEDPQNAIRVLRRAIDLGVNFIDTADSYGPNTNEQIIRTALHPYPSDLVICSKGGLLRSGPMDWSTEAAAPYIVPCGRPAYLRQQVEISLRNLGTDCIGLYELHRIDPLVPLADQLGELSRLKNEGKIRHIGVSGQPQVTVEQLEQCRAITEISAVENLYNIADRSGEAVVRYCEQHGVGFIPWFPLGHGELTKSGGALDLVAKERGYSAAQLALAWMLRASPNLLLIPGTTSVAHLENNMQADQVEFDEAYLTATEAAAAKMTPWRPGANSDEEEGTARLEGEHGNVAMLREIYADLTKLKQYASDSIVLHTAEREISGATKRVVGRDAVDNKERELIEMTNGTLVMDVQGITANAHFGAVTGVIRGEAKQGVINMPFCGLWRFENGEIVEHWENAYDPANFFESAVANPDHSVRSAKASFHSGCNSRPAAGRFSR